MYSTGNEIVDVMQGISITGNIIPAIWYKRITRDNGKPNLLAINLLADIVYWYRPSEIRDEHTGALIGFKKRFASDLLQRSYADISDFFGCSKTEATRAVLTLEHLGIVKRVFRTIVSNGVRSNNVLFIELIPEKLVALNSVVDSCQQESREVSARELIGVCNKVETNTEITSKTTTENTQIHKKESKKAPLKSFDELIDGYTENAELRGALRDYIQMRTAIRKKITNRGLELAFKKLDELARTDAEKIAIVDQSVMNSWQGLFPIKDNGRNYQQQPRTSYEESRDKAMAENKERWKNLPGMKLI